jgi:hypothetical protein
MAAINGSRIVISDGRRLMSDDMLPFSEAVRALRAEIIQAVETGKNEKLRFVLGSIELEFQVVAKREGGPSAKIKFGLLGMGMELGASGKFSSEAVHKVKLKLDPIQVGDDGIIEEVTVSKKPGRTRKRQRAG